MPIPKIARAIKARPGIFRPLLLFLILFAAGLMGLVRFSGGIAPPIQINGDWIISTPVRYSNVTIVVQGNITINSGGSLSLDNVSLVIQASTPLLYSITINGGGALVGKGGSISSSIQGTPYWIQARPQGSLNMSRTSLSDLGGPVSGEEGLIIQASGAYLNGVTFDSYYKAVRVIDASDVTITNSKINSSYSTNPSIYAVEVVGNSRRFTLRNTIFSNPGTVGALFITSPDNTVVGNHFFLNPMAANYRPVFLAYSSQGKVRADNTLFRDNTVQGAGVVVAAASNVTIQGNVINDTGPSHQFGVQAFVPIGIQLGIFVRNLNVTGNSITNYSRYGVRLEQNVSHFQVLGNAISYPLPSAAIGEAYGIYVLRGVDNGTIGGNHLEMYAPPNNATIGISLESRVNDVVIRDNVINNATENAINVQGNEGIIDGAPAYQAGPSLRNQVIHNTIWNSRQITQTRNLVASVLTWLWANETIVEGNVLGGWTKVNRQYTYNGAAFYTSSSFQTFRNNTVLDANFGFVFRRLSSTHEIPSYGDFNRSYNVVYGNRLVTIASQAVVEDANDGLGPIHNVINVLTDRVQGDGLPTRYFEVLGPIRYIGIQADGGQFTLTVETPSPVTRTTVSMATATSFTSRPFELELRSLDPNGWVTWPNATVRLGAGGNWSYHFNASGLVSQHLGPVALTSTFNVVVRSVSLMTNIQMPSASDGTLAFATQTLGWTYVNVTGTMSPTTSLPWPNGALTMNVSGQVSDTTSHPLSGVMVQVTVAMAGGAILSFWVTTDANGKFEARGVPVGAIAFQPVGPRGYQTKTISIQVKNGGTVTVSIVMTYVGTGGPGGRDGFPAEPGIFLLIILILWGTVVGLLGRLATRPTLPTDKPRRRRPPTSGPRDPLDLDFSQAGDIGFRN